MQGNGKRAECFQEEHRIIETSAYEQFQILGKIGEGGGFGFEGGNGFDQARDREGVAYAAGATDQAQGASLFGKADRDAHQGGNTGAVDLRNRIENDDDFASAILDDRLQGIVKLFTGFADGKATMNFKNRNAGGIADVDFHGGTVSHLGRSQLAAMHYTMKAAADKKMPGRAWLNRNHTRPALRRS